MRERQGCLAGLLQLFLLDTLFDFLQSRFGFGRGCSGIGCGCILLILFILMSCGVISGTDWLRLW
ncbi:MAG: hypothetical protein HZC40_10265 [Chloroflexi bacterium]|nr:hypothetical protein [Chloroflexota bacterium]